MEQKKETTPADGGAEQLVGSVAKYSISTVLNFVISGIALLLGSFVIPNQALYGEVVQFTTFTNTIMTIVIFGLDQGFIRFYSEPPGKAGPAGIFRLCFYLSTSVLVASGIVCSLFFAGPLRALFAFNQLGPEIIPLLFLNAFFWMVARYFYTLYRMEQNILHYTLVSLLMNFCYRLAHLLGALFTKNGFFIVLCSLFALGILALYLLVSRRKILRPRRADWDKPTLKALVPYSAAVAPTAVMVVLNSSFSLVFVATYINEAARGTYGYGVQVSNLVTAIQGGFASFWGAYMFANYKTRQPLIKKVHDYLNLVILVFFCGLVAFEDIIFLVLSGQAAAKPIFPVMMLGAVFTILCETTVYGITIARRPIFDTLGIALSFGLNVVLLFVLVPALGLLGAALALAGANLAMFVFRTLVAQRFYSTIRYPLKTIAALLLAAAVAAAGTLFTEQFVPKLLCCLAAAALYCLMYRQELVQLFKMGLSFLRRFLNRGKTAAK